VKPRYPHIAGPLWQAGEWIVRMYQDWGKPDDAAEWRTKIQRSH
jgi:hypothetical protein